MNVYSPVETFSDEEDEGNAAAGVAPPPAASSSADTVTARAASAVSANPLGEGTSRLVWRSHFLCQTGKKIYLY